MEADPARCERCSAEFGADALFCPMCGAPRARGDGDPLIGEVIADRYLLRERLGHGNSGTIYLAEHVTLRRRFAVKILHHELARDDLAVERFRREATTVGQIDNEHIVEVHDFGRAADGRLFLAMEYLEGETLARLIERERQVPIDKVVDVLTQVGEALMEAHAMGFVHRDLRPRNLFLSKRRGRHGFVKLLDFGLAKLVEKEGDAASTNLGMTFGDPRYMSPEQAQGEVFDRRADIYSLGVIAFEMLLGRPPFVGEKVFDVLTKHLEDEVPRPSSERKDVPAWLDAIVLRMLAKRAEDRFVTVYRIVEALKDGQGSGRIMSDDAARSMPAQPPPPPAPRTPRERRETALLPEKAIRQEVAGSGPAPAESNVTGRWFDEGEKLPDRTSGSLPITDQSRYIRLEDKKRDRRSFLIAGGIVAAIGAVVVVMAVWPSAGPGDARSAAGPGSRPDPVPVAAPAPVPDAAPVPVPVPVPVPDAAAAKEVVLKRPPPPVHRHTPPPPVVPHKEKEPPPEKAPPEKAPPAPANADQAQAEFFVKLGQKALRDGDVVAAAASFNKARGFNPKNAEAIAGLGEVALQQGYYREAIVHLQAGARLAPRSARIQLALGQAYLGNDQPSPAAAAFKKALKIQPDNEQARRGYEEAAARMK